MNNVLRNYISVGRRPPPNARPVGPRLLMCDVKIGLDNQPAAHSETVAPQP
jgi:hypothetical protein